jgi:hypothetical protein
MKDPYDLSNYYIVGFNTSFDQQEPDEYLQRVRAYKQLLQNINKLLIGTDWRTLTSASSAISTAESQLRDVISNLEDLGDDPEGKIDMTAILEHLNAALIGIYQCSDLSDQSDVHISTSRYSKIPESRACIKVAIGLLNIQ